MDTAAIRPRHRLALPGMGLAEPGSVGIGQATAMPTLPCPALTLARLSCGFVDVNRAEQNRKRRIADVPMPGGPAIPRADRRQVGPQKSASQCLSATGSDYFAGPTVVSIAFIKVA
jgi:hypothetical protein